MVHDGVLIIDREVVIASDGSHRAEAGQIVLTTAGVHGGARGVGVVRLRDGSKQLDVVVSQGRSGPATSAISTTAERVGGTGGHLLSAQLLQLPTGNGGVGLNLLSSGEGLGKGGLFVVNLRII